MRRRADPKDPAAELVELWAAPTPEELHRVLVLHPSQLRSANTLGPYQVLSKPPRDRADQLGRDGDASQAKTRNRSPMSACRLKG